MNAKNCIQFDIINKLFYDDIKSIQFFQNKWDCYLEYLLSISNNCSINFTSSQIGTYLEKF